MSKLNTKPLLYFYVRAGWDSYVGIFLLLVVNMFFPVFLLGFSIPPLSIWCSKKKGGVVVVLVVAVIVVAAAVVVSSYGGLTKKRKKEKRTIPTTF